jgi:hypothetical protein
VHSVDATTVLGLTLCVAPSGLVALPSTVAVHEMKIHSLLLGPVSTGYARDSQAVMERTSGSCFRKPPRLDTHQT